MNRFDLLTSSPHYWALEFHDDYKVFSDNLIAAEKARSTKEQARYLVVSLSRLVDLKSSLYAYVDFDKNSRRGIVSEEMRRRIYFAIPVARSELTSVLQCAISQL